MCRVILQCVSKLFCCWGATTFELELFSCIGKSSNTQATNVVVPRCRLENDGWIIQTQIVCSRSLQLPLGYQKILTNCLPNKIQTIPWKICGYNGLGVQNMTQFLGVHNIHRSYLPVMGIIWKCKFMSIPSYF